MKKVLLGLILAYFLCSANAYSQTYPLILPSNDDYDFLVGESWTGFNMKSDILGRSKIYLGINSLRPYSDVLSLISYDTTLMTERFLFSLNSDGGAMYRGKVNLDNSSSSLDAALNFNWQGYNKYFYMKRSEQDKMTFSLTDGSKVNNFMTFKNISGTLVRIGINKSDPQTALDIDGDITVKKVIAENGEFSANVSVNGNSTVTGNSTIGGNLDVTGNYGTSIKLNSEVSGYTLKLKTVGSEDWGIEHYNNFSDNTDIFGMGLRIMDNGSNGFFIRDKTSNQKRLVIRGGKIGIATDNPAYTLDVNGTINATDIRVNGNSLMDKVWIPVTEGLGYNGKVGINTLAPAYDLDVNGTINAEDIRINGNSLSDKLWIPITGGLSYDGNIGIGTTTPVGKFHVVGDIAAGNNVHGQKFLFHTRTSNSGDFMQLTVDDSKGNWQWNKGLSLSRAGNIGIGTTAPMQTLDVNGRMNVGDGVIQKGGSAITNTTDLGLYSRSNTWIRIVSNNQPIMFFTDGETDGGKGTNPILRIDTTGTVGHGTVTVDGKLRAEEIMVETINWPDYVFEKDYDLLNLKEVEKHIETEGHLPDMPSAEEVNEKGVNVGEMTNKLLKKIEELTLYVIEQDKKIEQLQTQVNNSNSKK